MIKAWDSFIIFSAKNPVVYVDISCAKQNRYPHLVDIFKRANIYDLKLDTIIKDYAEQWASVGNFHDDHPIKVEYLTKRTLPKYNWGRLNRHVMWYEQQKQKIHDNLAP